MILKVLIAEDEEIIRRGMMMTIDWLGMGCTVVGAASNGEEGVRLIHELKPDVVLADIRMPLMDGLQMIAEAAQGVDFHSVLLTSYAEFEYAQQAITLHCDGYLLKPLEEEQLRTLLEHIRTKVKEEKQLRRIDALGASTLPLAQEIKAPYEPLVEETLRRIRESGGEHLSIEDIADELMVSASYLSRRFKVVTGTTFLDALNRHRLQPALEAMKHGHVSFAEVADEVGFTDYKHFCSVFKRYLGITPSEYRRGGRM